MKRKINDKQPLIFTTYRLIHVIFAGVIVFILLYSFVFGAGGRSYPLQSGTRLFSSESTVSTGLSRSFTAIMHGKLKQAHALNPYGMRIFLFFILQFLFRLTGYILTFRTTETRISKIIVADAVLSVAAFIIFFMPFIAALIRQ